MSVWRGLRSDLVLALRRFAEAPGFTFVCVVTLALGIGGNSAVFTLIDRVILEPLPVERPSELYRLGDADDCCVNSGLAGSYSLFSYELYTHLRDRAPDFTNLAAFEANTKVFTIGSADDAAPMTLNGAFVSGNYFQTFGLAPASGRLIQPSDDRRGAHPVAVISYRAWADRYQARAGVIGSGVTLNGVPATIIGVAPAGFYGETLRPNPPEIWVPLSNEPLLQPATRLLEAKAANWLYVIGRLQPGAAVPPLQIRLTLALQQWLGSNLDLSNEGRNEIPKQHIEVVSAAGGVASMRDAVAPSLKLLQMLAAAVLLIACANLAALLLARGTARRIETAVRVALGATRPRLVAQFLIESVLVACAGGVAGLVLSVAGARAIINLAFRGAPDIPVDPSPSLVVIGFAFAVSLLTGALFGAVPALIGSRTDPADAIRGSGRVTSERGSRVRRTLVALQVAMSLVLITCAGLLGRSLQKLEAQDLGFRTEGRYIVELAPSLTTVPASRLPSMYPDLQQRLQRIPGVGNAAYSLYAPMSGDNWASSIVVEGHDRSARLNASWNRVSPGYFETVGTPVIRGRVFDRRDTAESPLVAVVTQSFARKFFGDRDPIGRRLGFTNDRGQGAPEFEIIGVVGDAKYQDGRAAPYVTFFLPFLQQSSSEHATYQSGVELDRSHYPQAIEIQTFRSVHGLENEIRRALAQVDHRITVRTVVPMGEQVARAFNIERLIARLTVAFGLVALLLACLGLYGVTAYSVTRRTREIGIRIAVGASRWRVLQTVLRGALAQLAIGVVIGVHGAYVAGRLLQAQLFGVSSHDPLILAGGVVLLVFCAIAATLLPARRAAAMNPVDALRVE